MQEMPVNPQPSSSTSSKPSLLVPGAVIAIIAVAAIALYTTRNTASTPASDTSTSMQQTGSPTETVAADFQDGMYQVEGMYISPGGPRTINVALQLENGVITSSEFEGLATDPTSQRFQKEFGDNYQPMVVGKKINEIQLTKVSGSSLTPKGFMDALEKVKSQATL